MSLYMINHWVSYIDNLGKLNKEATFCTGEDSTIPWFAYKVNDYEKMNKFEKSIYSINALTKLHKETFENLKSSEKARSLIIPFESFAIEPEYWLNKIKTLLSSDVTKSTKKWMKMQKSLEKILMQEKETL